MEALLIAEIIKVKPANPTEHIEHLSENTQAPVYENHYNLTGSTGASICKSAPGTTRLQHECLQFGKLFTHKFDLKQYEKSLHCVTEEFLPAITELVPTQEILTLQPTSSNEDLKQLSVSVQPAVTDDSHMQTSSIETSICNSAPGTTRLQHECLQCGKLFTHKFDLKQHEKSLHCVTEEFLPAITELVPTKEILTVQPTSSNEDLKQPIKSVQPAVTDDGHTPTISIETSICNSAPGTTRLQHECLQCGKFFARKFHLKRHERNLHPSTEFQSDETGVVKNTGNESSHCGKNFHCDKCEQLFSRKYYLHRHALRVHSKIKLFECDVCQKKFCEKSHLNRHKRVHTGEKPFQCEICLMKFNQKSHVDIHKHFHTGEKPYQCPTCMKMFSTRSVLNTHRRIHSGEKPHECEVCMKKFRSLSDLKRHASVHTREKPHQCEICMKSYGERSALYVHRRVHTGEKPYQCEICTKSYRDMSALCKHRRTHTGEKYECEICFKTYGEKCALNKHKRVHAVH